MCILFFSPSHAFLSEACRIWSLIRWTPAPFIWLESKINQASSARLVHGFIKLQGNAACKRTAVIHPNPSIQWVHKQMLTDHPSGLVLEGMKKWVPVKESYGYMLRKRATNSLGINLLINGLGIDQLTEIPSPCMPSYSIAIDGSTCARARSLYTNPNAPRSPRTFLALPHYWCLLYSIRASRSLSFRRPMSNAS